MLSEIRQKAFISLICLVPFAHFILQKVDIWHAQGYFFQIGILILFSLKLFEHNKPLSILTFWFGFLTMFYWLMFHIQTKDKYFTYSLMPFFNFLCIVLLYMVIREFLTKEYMKKLARYFCIVLVIEMVYALLQKFNLDQFQRSYYISQNFDYVVGTIGNPMHFAHFLAISSPMFFLLTPKWCVAGLISALSIIYLTGAMSGLVIFLLVTLFYLLLSKKISLRETMLFIMLFLLVGIWQRNNIFDDNNRFLMWDKFYPIFQEKPITGYGLGMTNKIAQMNNLVIGNSKQLFRFMHNEYYQFIIETGIIGLGVIFWCIFDWFRRFLETRRDNVDIVAASMFLAFLLCSLVGFPAHLWVLGSIGLVSYTYFYRRQDADACRDTQ